MKARRKVVRAKNRRTGKVVELNEDRAYELFIGGLIGMWGLAIQMKLSDKAQAALFLAMHEGIKAATPKALVAVYHSLGGVPLPGGIGGLMLARTAIKKPNRGRR